ncbi:unnamed protein product [Allacma fusca]|uniref:Uncharacterized protein n=1 Tax=Allacma fusca TaxID=39272 RepID=A0A8J2KLS8_9HEXA|nr:unnamed protein product [Allacma fusca]
MGKLAHSNITKRDYFVCLGFLIHNSQRKCIQRIIFKPDNFQISDACKASIVSRVSLNQSTAHSPEQEQPPEYYPSADIVRFPGTYSFLGSFIAVREAYFLLSLAILVWVTNLILSFFQIPSFYLPIHQPLPTLPNPTSLLSNFPNSLFTGLPALSALSTIPGLPTIPALPTIPGLPAIPGLPIRSNDRRMTHHFRSSELKCLHPLFMAILFSLSQTLTRRNIQDYVYLLQRPSFPCLDFTPLLSVGSC